jgi:hypothetical protein
MPGFSFFCATLSFPIFNYFPKIISAPSYGVAQVPYSIPYLSSEAETTAQEDALCSMPFRAGHVKIAIALEGALFPYPLPSQIDKDKK